MITIKDIAKAAGVTYVTVSRALNDEPGVGEQTRQKIKAIAEKMNYVPSLAAKKLVQRQPNTIGLIWPQIKGMFFYDLSFELQQEASRRGLQVILSMAKPEEALRTFNHYFVDYVIFWRQLFNPTLEFLQEKEKFRGEMLLIGGWKTDKAHSITIDRAGGFRDAVHHLAGLGHKRIAFVGMPDLDKHNGYMQGMAELKLDFSPEYVVVSDDPSFEQKLSDMMCSADKPTALIVDCHGILHEITGKLKKLNVRIPEDLSLVVYDDTQLQFFDIPLTTVGPSIPELAARSFDILTGAANREDGPRWIEEEIKSKLTPRSSTIPYTGR
ncbi:LacI family DNA-binding transcriptional regulator [Paenibacillus oceani]|uniref:LacI family DNA-binding transcriptional regulator n=1 Tax=Paenibacillus oceani TaxID=2772510 RepID=A0A927CFV8_9BACL|nr:LacI family DNA-binding transcriptional regulator [Paenibacillus oceani]MBD2865461.1 LacI family DNA-binding transcriptional regulator [Paenibacillus oceani]